jgi:LysR family transcriptional activator of nhaA
MEWLNYHHFLYFWVVAKEGTIVKAGEKLMLAHPTISGQIHRLEQSLGTKLFQKRGRRLELTESGQVAFRYAEEIFNLGRDFVDTIKGHASSKALRLIVGVAGVVPASMVRLFLEPAFSLGHDIQMVVRADSSVEEFLVDLALHRIDVVISDGPAPSGVAVRAFSHLLGECDTTFFAAPAIANKLRRNFPHSLHGAPFLMPGARSAVRRALDEWFSANGIRPKIVAECDEGSLIKDLGMAGKGVFAAPVVIEAEVKRQYAVGVVGRSNEVRRQFYAISGERKIKHPAVAAISDAARNTIFATK